MSAAAVILSICLAAPAPQVVVLDAEQRMVVPRATPNLPSDEELAEIKVSPEILRLARELDAATLAERRAARDAIAARKPTPEELMALLLRTDLSAEARHQLVGVLRDRILFAPRGALGIRMENVMEPGGGVRIIALIPGMPAEKVLKVGDIVINVNGAVVRHTGDLVSAVQTLPPGVEIPVIAKRVRAEALAGRRPAEGVADPAGAGQPVQTFEEVTVLLRLGSTEELEERGAAAGPLGGRVVPVAGLTFERRATAKLAADRFLPTPDSVPFPKRDDADANRPPATVESVRRVLVELQLAGGDAQLARDYRRRLDAIAGQFAGAVDEETRAKLQALLEELELEIRSAM